MFKLSFAIVLLSCFCLELSQAIRQTVNNCTDGPTEGETITLGSEELCIPIEMGTTSADLVPRTSFSVDISSVTPNFMVELEYETTAGAERLEESCVQRTDNEGAFVWIAIDNDTVLNQLELRVGSNHTKIKFFSSGLHLIGTPPIPRMYTFPEEKPRFLSVYEFQSSQSSQRLTICKVDGNGVYTKTDNNLLYFSRINNERMNERFCRSFTSLTDRGLFEELEIITNNADKLYENSNSIEILVSNKNCEVAADRVNAIVITLIRQSTTVSTPTATATPSATTPSSGTDDSKLSNGDIAGIVIGVLLPVALVVVVALATTYFVVKRYRNKNPPREQRSDEDREAVGTEMRTVQPEEAVNVKKWYLWNLCPDLEHIDELLLNGSPGVIPENYKEDHSLLVSLIRQKSCQAFYLVHRESREDLMTSNPVTAKLLRDFITLNLPSKDLKKLIDVRFHSEQERLNSESSDLILVIDMSEKEWRENPKQCAKRIVSRVGVHQDKLKRSQDDPDGGLSSSESSSSTNNSPRNHSQSYLPQITTEQQLTAPPVALRESSSQKYTLEPARPTHPPQPSQPPTTQGRVEPPPPSYSSGASNQPLIGDELGKEILEELKNISKYTGMSADAGQRSASGIQNIGEKFDENSAALGEVQEAMVRQQVAKDAEEGT